MIDPVTVLEIWEREVQHTLSEESRTRFLSRSELRELGMMDLDVLTEAARTARAKSLEGHLLLREWVLVARGAASRRKQAKQATTELRAQRQREDEDRLRDVEVRTQEDVAARAGLICSRCGGVLMDSGYCRNCYRKGR